MIDIIDVIAGAVLGAVLVSILPNRFVIWTWKPKTKWGKKRVRERVNRWSL